MESSCNRDTESNTGVSFSLEFNPLKMKKEGSKPSKIDILVCFCPYLDIKKTLTYCIKVVLSIWRRKGDLNPRGELPPYELSKPAPSASWVFLQSDFNCTIKIIVCHQYFIFLHNQIIEIELLQRLLYLCKDII